MDAVGVGKEDEGYFAAIGELGEPDVVLEAVFEARVVGGVFPEAGGHVGAGTGCFKEVEVHLAVRWGRG